MMLPKTILILAANPKGTSQLRLDEEVREIDLALQLSQRREMFTLKQKWAVRQRDVHRAILDCKPQIVHFSGHGEEKQGLVFEDENGQVKFVNAEALASLFQVFAPYVDCVILNACYSESQVKAISQHIDYVIGMKQSIGDKSAIDFAVGFYDALGAGESYEFAFNLGRSAIQMGQRQGIAEQFVPTLYIRHNEKHKNEKHKNEKHKVVVIEGELDSLDEAKIKALIQSLQKRGKDLTIEIVAVEKSSIKIIIKGTEEGLQRIQELFNSGKLEDLENLKVIRVRDLDQQEQRKVESKKKPMTITDKQLQQLIDRISNNPDPKSSARRKAINRLLKELQQLPGLLRSSNRYYLEALDKTWEWVAQNICNFQQRSHLSLQESLAKWINSYLFWRIKDLYSNRQYSQEISIDMAFNLNDQNPTSLLDQLSKTGFASPTLSGLDAYIEEQRKKKIQDIFERFERYVEEDPEMLLRKCHPRNFPECHCQLLTKKLLLQEPPERLSQIHREFQNLGVKIPDQTLRSHWKNKCLPLLQNRLESLGYSKDEES
ncbi:CHAT domain-containing protein [Aphanothece sacrum]|uniref:CHAT domain protein n=1 Tax=Aphanothece sacrum FPU1 TaxID=1920663 RepID=A0A401ID21_APHSA|nr:CHAT domain-containing protein [Aphanothece sacrum]GBF79175.1 CHAT domain protein [Aphanothece sacrum FPU1]GBF86564.1 hypothetical protein AsFPU3_3635 [Aphanothece sacrum FPU3]